MTRTICVTTGSRAEYGLLRWVMEAIRGWPGLKLQVIATGMHLSPEFGLTYQEIEQDGVQIDRQVETLLSSDTPVGLAKSIGLGVIGFADTLAQLRPDVMVVLGDRFETFAAVTAAMVAGIPVVHLHGGETTEGVIDEPIRHAITKMSHLHFVAAEEYRRRVIQLGEQPQHVFTVGSLGVDSVKRLPLLDKQALEASLGFSLGKRHLVITFHPLSLELGESDQQMAALLSALASLRDTQLIFTMPNADTDGRRLADQVRGFVAAHDNARLFANLGQLRYFSAIRFAVGVVGNSSSGIIEVPSLHKGTVNIGARQRGRLRAESVIDCDPTQASIEAALKRLYSPEFQSRLSQVRNPYGDGGASDKIVRILAEVPLGHIVNKRFFDVNTPWAP